MRNIVTILSLLAITATGCINGSRSNTSVLTGQIEGIEEGALVIRVGKTDLMGTEFSDTVKVDSEGKFTYTLNDPDYRSIIVQQTQTEEEKAAKIKAEYFQAIMLPGETVTVTGTMNSPKITSNGFYADKERADQMLKHLNEELESTRKSFIEREKGGEDNNALNMEFQLYFAEWMVKHDAIALDFIKANPNSNYSYYLAVSMKEPARSEAMGLLSDKVKEGPVKSFDLALNAIMKANEERQRSIEQTRAKLAPGMPAPDFTLKTINGNNLSLSSLKGKYVILDFWGSWCTWCIKGIPHMKEYYKKYSKRVEILGIACGDTPAQWQKAVKDNVLPWKNVINDEEGGTDVSKIYAITGYPTKVIIDPDGNIVKYFVGESSEFYSFLDNLFK